MTLQRWNAFENARRLGGVDSHGTKERRKRASGEADMAGEYLTSAKV
jgi:hypothetical protein